MRGKEPRESGHKDLHMLLQVASPLVARNAILLKEIMGRRERW
jgi:hypothetical protein